jgi:Domain of unknown function (DUF4173)
MTTSSAAPIWTAATLTAALGAAILYDAGPAINFTIWVAAAALSVVGARWIYRGRIELPLAILLGWATLLSVRFAIHGEGFADLLTLMSVAMLLGLAIITIGTESWGQLSAKLLAVVPGLAPFRVWRASARQVMDARRPGSSPRSRALIKGTLLSAPLVILLIVLLGNADPVIRWATDHIASWLPDWSFPPRLLFFVFLLSITLGAVGLAARQAEAALPNLPVRPKGLTIGVTEQQMVLWSAAVVLWLFVVLQVSYLIHPPPAVVNSTVTFAEYARRGFAELSVAATVVGAILLVLESTKAAHTSENDRRMVVRLELALLIALELILFSAFRRVILYEQAYGFTSARLVAEAYMVVMALALVALAVEIRRGFISVNFARRVAEIALGVFTIIALWNFEGWIVNQNIDRGVRTGKFDLDYASTLSADAIPTLIARRSELGPTIAAEVEKKISCSARVESRRWFEWNRSAEKLHQALVTAHPGACPEGQSPTWPRYYD